MCFPTLPNLPDHQFVLISISRSILGNNRHKIVAWSKQHSLTWRETPKRIFLEWRKARSERIEGKNNS